MFTFNENTEYAAVSLGEVMLRLDPGENRVRAARSFVPHEGGGEYNVARGLSKCFGLKTAVITALVRNDIGFLIEDLILAGGVDTSFIYWMPFDGTGKIRNGLNFTERGFGVRAALGVSDRAYSAAGCLSREMIDFELFKRGVKWLHTGGIYAALSDTASDTAETALKTAKSHGVITSFDLNFRPSLWKGRESKAQETNRRLMPFIDVLIGNEEDFSKALGFDTGGIETLDRAAYTRIHNMIFKEYPNISLIATTLRGVKSASVNTWTAICSTAADTYTGIQFDSLEILDRVGGGDSFASGLIYGLLSGCELGVALNYGICHGALAGTTPGDTSYARKHEVEALMDGKTARVVR